MKLIVGLGNPGSEYQNTRHNVGFIAVDKIIDRYNFSSPKNKFGAIISEGMIDSEKFIVIKPLSYMNNSGKVVRTFFDFYKILSQDIIVIHDEIDLDFGKVKTKIGGGAAGHNGLKSIDAHIGREYHRIRIGIGRPVHGEVSDYVLSKFTKDELISIDSLTDDIAINFPIFLDCPSLFLNKIQKG